MPVWPSWATRPPRSCSPTASHAASDVHAAAADWSGCSICAAALLGLASARRLLLQVVHGSHRQQRSAASGDAARRSACVSSAAPLHSVHSSHGLHAAAVARALIAYHPNVSARDSDLWLGKAPVSGLQSTDDTVVHRDSLERLRLGVADLTGTRLLAARPWSHCRLGGIQ